MEAPSLYKLSLPCGSLRVEEREILRYMGYGGAQVDDENRRVASLALDMVRAGSLACAVYTVSRVELSDDWIDIGFGRFASRDVLKYIQGCEKAVIFAATIGICADRLVNRFTNISPARALALNSAGTALIEAYCDRICGELGDRFKAEGYRMRPRFSAGYGDFPLMCQRGLLRLLRADKILGISLNDSLLMTPSKSVTAVAGLEKL